MHTACLSAVLLLYNESVNLSSYRKKLFSTAHPQLNPICHICKISVNILTLAPAHIII